MVNRTDWNCEWCWVLLPGSEQNSSMTWWVWASSSTSIFVPPRHQFDLQRLVGRSCASLVGWFISLSSNHGFDHSDCWQTGQLMLNWSTYVYQQSLWGKMIMTISSKGIVACKDCVIWRSYVSISGCISLLLDITFVVHHLEDSAVQDGRICDDWTAYSEVPPVGWNGLRATLAWPIEHRASTSCSIEHSYGMTELR